MTTLSEYLKTVPPPQDSLGLLSGEEIKRQIELRNIIIDPYDPALVGPNSLDVRLGPQLIEVGSGTPNAMKVEGGEYSKPYSQWDMDKFIWDITKPIPGHHTATYTIGEEGFVLRKGVCYLAHTIERTECKCFVPWLDTRSTVGRYFLQCHTTAGRGDVGWSGCWTLELISLAHDLRVYAGLPIAQVSFFSIQGRINPYQGRYNGQTGPQLPKPLRRV